MCGWIANKPEFTVCNDMACMRISSTTLNENDSKKWGLLAYYLHLSSFIAFPVFKISVFVLNTVVNFYFVKQN